MVVKVNLPKKQPENGHEPTVAPEQAAPIAGAPDLPWKTGEVNDGYSEAQPAESSDKPAPPPQNSPNVDSGVGDGGVPDCPPPPPLEAYGQHGNAGLGEHGDVGTVGVQPDTTEQQAPSQGTNPTPSEVGTTETAQPQLDGQTEVEESSETEAGQIEAVAETQQAAVDTGTVTTSKALISHGNTMSTHNEAEQVKVAPVAGQAARVRYSCGFTKNIGEFNSLRAEVSIELPSTVNQVEETYAAAVAFVDGKLQQLWNDA